MAFNFTAPLTGGAAVISLVAGTPSLHGELTSRFIPWEDPSPHQVRHIAVGRGVELEVLDWGGTGEPLVFLTGFGNTAHVFDNFAPAFVPRFHVLGITRRGFGSSSKPAAGYDTTTLVRDILGVLDSLQIPRASFVAHSFGGSELNYLGAHFPGRVHRLVYLDAAVDHRQLYDTPAWMKSFPTPQPPTPTYGDYGGNSIAAWVLWAERLSGPGYPEAEIRSMFRYDSTDTVIGPVAADTIDRVLQRGTLPAELSRIRVPVLAIYAAAGSAPVFFPFWNSMDPTSRARAEKTFEVISGIWVRQEDRFRAEVPNIRIREIPGARHYVFLTSAGEVQHEMLDFLLGPG